MKHNQLDQILAAIMEANSVLLFPHVQMDGDSFGSCVALCRSFRNAGKESYVIITERIPENLQFLIEGDCATYCTEKTEFPKGADLCIAVDCSDADRLTGRTELFLSGKTTACIDHHITHETFAMMNFIDTKAAATGEIVFRILKALGGPIDLMTAEAIYTAIMTDTGSFQYSNTTKKTHQIVAELHDSGIDHNKISVNLFQNVRREKLLLTGLALADMEFFAGGKGCLTVITKETLARSGALMNESDGIVEQLRNIRGVELSVVLKEEEGRIKVGLRSKSDADVASISKSFGGGGHKKAAGCSLETSIGEAKAIMMKAAEEELLRVFG